MSRLVTRIERLEQMLPPCRECRSRRREIELATPGQPGRQSRGKFCPGCGEPLERLTVALAFDPHWQGAGAGGASPEAGT